MCGPPTRSGPRGATSSWRRDATKACSPLRAWSLFARNSRYCARIARLLIPHLFRPAVGRAGRRPRARPSPLAASWRTQYRLQGDSRGIAGVARCPALGAGHATSRVGSVRFFDLRRRSSARADHQIADSPETRRSWTPEERKSPRPVIPLTLGYGKCQARNSESPARGGGGGGPGADQAGSKRLARSLCADHEH